MQHDPWRSARNGMQMALFAWLINACTAVLISTAYTAILTASASGHGTDSDWKLLDRLGVMSSFIDVAAMTVVAIGMMLVARAPAQARAGGLAVGAFVCALVTLLINFIGLVDQLLMATKLAREPILDWQVAKYVYTFDGLISLTALALFVFALFKVGGALGAGDAAWKGILALAAIALGVLLTTIAMHLPSLGAFRMDNRWLWFFVTRPLRALGDVMLLLFLAHLLRASRSRSQPSPG